MGEGSFPAPNHSGGYVAGTGKPGAGASEHSDKAALPGMSRTSPMSKETYVSVDTTLLISSWTALLAVCGKPPEQAW